MEQLKADIGELKNDVKLLVAQSAVHNVLLAKHEQRSMLLEERQEAFLKALKPIETHVKLMNIFIGAIGTILVAALTAFIQLNLSKP